MNPHPEIEWEMGILFRFLAFPDFGGSKTEIDTVGGLTIRSDWVFGNHSTKSIFPIVSSHSVEVSASDIRNGGR